MYFLFTTRYIIEREMVIYMGLTSWGQRIDKSKIESACNSIKDNPSTDLSLAGTKFREVATDLDNDKVLLKIDAPKENFVKYDGQYLKKGENVFIVNDI